MPYDQTRPAPPADKLQFAINLAKAGQRVEARDILRQIVARQPLNQAAWFWLSAVASGQAEAEAALAQVRQINPTHPSLAQAERWLAQRFPPQPVTAASQVVKATFTPALLPVNPTPAQNQNLYPKNHNFKPAESGKFLPFTFIPHPSLFNWLVLGLMTLAIVVGLAILFLGLVLEVKATVSPAASPTPNLLNLHSPALAAARAEHNWTEVIAILEKLPQIGSDSSAIKNQLSYAYLQKGMALRHKGFVEEAIPLFKQAIQTASEQKPPQKELRLALNYLDGVKHYQAGRWPEAIIALEKVRTEDSNYVHLKDLLYSAYYNYGLARQAAEDLTEARRALRAAIALRPDLPELRRKEAEIEHTLPPPTPPITATLVASTTTNKLIVVGIAEQRMHVYKGDKLIFDFIVSTGEPGRDTAIGEFEILDKIDVAYASTWNLDMPYWMGIYWAGSLEDGIHALPIVKHTGYKLWDGYLGQRVSYGCVILSDEDAATLFKWADIGTKVKIVPSLADWPPEDERGGNN